LKIYQSNKTMLCCSGFVWFLCRHHRFRGVTSKCIWEYTSLRIARGWIYISVGGFRSTMTLTVDKTPLHNTMPHRSRLDQTATWYFTWVEAPGELNPNSIKPLPKW